MIRHFIIGVFVCIHFQELHTVLLIKNKGAECYFNGLLQAIVNERNISSFIRETGRSRVLFGDEEELFEDTAEVLYKKNSLGKALQDFTKIYHDEDLDDTAYVSADELTKKLFEIYPKAIPSAAYGTGMQSNPSAALPLLNNITTDRMPETPNPFATYFTEIETYPGGITLKKPEKYHLSLKIPLSTRDELEKTKKAQLPLEAYLNREYVNFKSKRKDPLSADYTLTRKLTRLPDVLIIDTDDPEGPYTFPMETIINPKNVGLTGEPITYKLYAVIMRSSAGGLGGHYYTFVKYGSTWYVCDEPESAWYGGDKDITTIRRSDLKLKNQNLINEIAKRGSHEHRMADYQGGKPVTVTLNDYPSMLFYTRGTLDTSIKKSAPPTDLIDLQRNLTLLTQVR